jgi:hypothetical protein
MTDYWWKDKKQEKDEMGWFGVLFGIVFGFLPPIAFIVFALWFYVVKPVARFLGLMD